MIKNNNYPLFNFIANHVSCYYFSIKFTHHNIYNYFLYVYQVQYKHNWWSQDHHMSNPTAIMSANTMINQVPPRILFLLKTKERGKVTSFIFFFLKKCFSAKSQIGRFSFINHNDIFHRRLQRRRDLHPRFIIIALHVSFICTPKETLLIKSH